MFHDYPYTDFHELNLDWLLAEWKKFLNEYVALNGRIDDMETTIGEFRNYFDTLDVQEEINNKLDEMMLDGSLETLLAHYVYFTHNPDLYQILNVPMITHQYDYSGNVSQGFIQGYTSYGGSSYMAFIDHTGQLNDIIIRKYANDSGTLIGEGVIVNGGHANSLTVHEGHLLMTTLNNSIISIDPITLDQEIVYPTQRNITWISSYNHILYGGDVDGNLIVITLAPEESYTVLSNYQINNPAYNFIQSGCVYDNYLYVISMNPKVIAVISIETGTIRNIINIDDYYYFYPTGEIEDLAIESGDEVYLASCTYGSYDNYRTARVFNFSLNQNDSRKQTYAGGDYNPIDALYVGNNSNGNPSGTANNPFQTISQAMQALSSPLARSYQIADITLNKDCPEIVYIRNSRLRILGNGHSIIRCSAQVSDLSMTNVKILAGSVTDNQNALLIANCNISLNDINIDGIYAGTAEACVALNRSSGLFVNITTDAANKIKVYRCNVKSNSADIRKIVYSDAVSALPYQVDLNSLATPSNRGSIYRLLCIKGYRNTTTFTITVSAGSSSTRGATIAYDTNGNMLLFIADITYSDNVLNVVTDGYLINTDGSRTQLTGTPYVITTIWYE